jgi:hypothetical protein
VLRATSINYTGYLNEPTYIWDQKINNTGGYAAFAVSSHLPAGSKTGGSPPPLVTVNFKGNGVGTSPLRLSRTILVDDRSMEVTHQTLNGTAQVELVSGHDAAITGLASSKSVVCQGCNASFTLSLQNQGIYPETFNVTLYANTLTIETKTITMTSGESKLVTFRLAPANLPVGNYTFRAELTTNEDIDPSDNTLADGTIPIAIQGDINADGKVNILDVSAAAVAFGSGPQGKKWNPNADLNEDQVINIIDIAKIARNFGKTS